MNAPDFTIVLAGNPNCGKTALFNALTGSRQRVGNWPGVTVEKKTGYFQYQNKTMAVVDLPGVYSTSVSSETAALDEKITCQYLLSGEADVMVNILDASNLERNLYLTLQLLEMKIPTVVAVNMMDVVKKRGVKIDLEKLSQLLGCPVVGIVARQQQGIDQLKKTILETKQNHPTPTAQLSLPSEINHAVQQLMRLLSIPDEKQAAWFALRLLEDDPVVVAHTEEAVVTAARQAAKNIEQQLQQQTDVLIADARYRLAHQITSAVTTLLKSPKKNFTQTLDNIVLNRYLGVPIFLVVMYLMFVFAINVGGAFQDFFDISSATIFVNGMAHLLTWGHVPAWLTAVLANGLGKGINTTLTFIPVIGGMFLFLSFLEDSGYMARAAFVMDRLMRALGLPGKSFVPMIVGFGCNVPAVMGARTLENPRDRILTVMMMPFMSCGARLAIFAVFASAFFQKGGAAIIFILYVVGILIAVLTGLLLRKTVLPGKPAPLVMELPPYHVPRLGSLGRHLWQRLKSFLARASRVIIPVCIILGVLNSITLTGKLTEENNQQSLLSVVGRVITPVFAPMGISQNNWPATVGLTTGILAKEVVIGTLNTLYSQQNNIMQQAEQFNFWGGLRDAALSIPQNLSQLGDAFKNPVAASEAPHAMSQAAGGVMYREFGGKMGAFFYLLFVLLYFPCVSTMAVMRREIGARWALFSVGWSTGLAYALAVMGYQLFSWVAHPVSSLLWVGGWGVILGVVVVVMRRYAHRDHYPATPLGILEKTAGSSLTAGGCGLRCQMCQGKKLGGSC